MSKLGKKLINAVKELRETFRGGRRGARYYSAKEIKELKSKMTSKK